jgi:hypothetical protein
MPLSLLEIYSEVNEGVIEDIEISYNPIFSHPATGSK